jgi:rhomboid protease GluP
MCPNCRAFISASDKVCPYCETQVGMRAIDRRSPSPLLGFIPHARFTTVTLLTLNFGLYLAMMIASMRGGNNEVAFDIDGRTLFNFGAKLSQAVFAGQWWRLITAGFLHGGLLHIMMNSWALFDLGAQVEEIYGTSRLIVFYFVATFFGFFASTLWSPSLSVGSSAGLFGLIGAMIALGVKHRSALGEAIRAMYVRWAMYGLLFGLLPGLAIDNAAHLGGLAAGFGIAYVLDTPALYDSFKERLVLWTSYACLLATVYCFIQMFLWFSLARG